MRLKVGPLLFAVAAACAAPLGGSIPVDHAGFRERWRRACELEKMSAFEGSCAEIDAGISEVDPDSNGPTPPDDAAGAEPPDEMEAAPPVGQFSPSPSGQPSYGPGGGYRHDRVLRNGAARVELRAGPAAPR